MDGSRLVRSEVTNDLRENRETALGHGSQIVRAFSLMDFINRELRIEAVWGTILHRRGRSARAFD